METNVSGRQELYLWVGLAGTIDRPGFAVDPVQAQSMRLDIGESAVILPLESWHEDTRNSPYDIPVPLQQSMRAPVTTEQLQQISRAQQLSVVLIDGAGEDRAYSYWNGKSADWQGAEAEAELGFQVRVQTPRGP